ncbi:extracellular solute-binding protein [soil metagenome]
MGRRARLTSLVLCAGLVGCTPGATRTVAPSVGGPGGSAPTTSGGPAGSVPTTSGGPSSPGTGGEASIDLWFIEDVQTRVEAMQSILDGFEAETGIQVSMSPIGEDQLQQQITAAAAGDALPDVFGALSLGFVHSLATDGISDPAAAQAVVDALGSDTFSPRALELVTIDGGLIAVPSDTWAQLLVYRTDLFDSAGLEPPTTFDTIMAAATELDGDGMAGIVAATGPADTFTQQTFEYFALANDCEVVDDAGTVTLESPQCVETFRFYTDLITDGSVPGIQDADTTRATYFAGDAAMIVWSTFLLDELAGLRNDAPPSCPECEENPRFLAENSGIVTAIQGPSGADASQFGEMVSYTITTGADTEAAQRFVEYMMSDGYVDQLALAPEGKFPARLGDGENPNAYVEAWQGLETGVDERAPLSEIFPAEALDALGRSTDTMDRWGFPQGQGGIVGPLLVELPVPAALGTALDGSATPEEAAAEAQIAVQEIVDSVQ